MYMTKRPEPCDSPEGQGGAEAQLKAEFARYLKAWTRGDDVGEPEFDGLTEFSDLAEFFVALAKRRFEVFREQEHLVR